MKHLYVIFLIVLSYLSVLGHGDVQILIDAVTKSITDDPKNPELYVKRAGLYLEDGDIKNTMLDLETVEEMMEEPFPPAVITYAILYQSQGEYQIALNYINQYLEIKHIDVSGFILKAQLLEELNDVAHAIDFYKKAIIHANDLLPESYFDLIRNLENESRHAEVLFYCNEAMRKLGRLVVFELKIIETAMATGDHQKALRVLDGVIDGSERKEKWYYKKAQLFIEIGDYELADGQLDMALESIRVLSPKLIANPAMQTLMSDIKNDKARLASLIQENGTTGYYKQPKIGK